MSTLRVLTYNIFNAGRRGAPLHELVRQVTPDVLLVNESPKRPLLWRRDCKRFCDLWRMRYVTGGRDAGSNLIAVRGPVEVRWSHTEVIAQPRFQPRRGVAVAQLRVHGRLLGVVSCHLSLDPQRREQEIGHVLAAAAPLRGPVILGGDLNETAAGPSWQRVVRAGFVDPGDEEWLTFPAEAPRRRIDALLVRGGARVLRHGDPGVPVELQVAASDHRPVLAELEL
ncbi:MAG: endonuclease/exonuclease/phosphatase family protein [Marmoricola sp.]